MGLQKRVDDIEIQALWQKYFASNDKQSKNMLLITYSWLIKYVIRQMNIPPNHLLGNDDLTNIGILGLNEAIERFSLERGVKFESYAIPRIRGVIQDELRRLDWLSRTARKRVSDLTSAKDELRSEMGREVSQDEIMGRLGVGPEKYKEFLRAAEAAQSSLTMSENQIIQYDGEQIDILETIADPSDSGALESLVDEERVDLLLKFLSDLNDKHRLIMNLYYYEELNFREIGKVLDISESRVCQLHGKILSDLKIKLRDFDYA